MTLFRYDANNNLIRITKPEGNTVEFDYDERDLKILERVGYDAATGQPGALRAYSYDGNRNLINVIGPVDHNYGEDPSATSLTVYIVNAFGSGAMLSHTGDWALENTYDGFDRIVAATDAIGNVVNSTFDPTSSLIQRQSTGPIGGDSPIDRDGTDNVSLSNSIMRFDEALRLYEVQGDVFLASDALPSGRDATHTGGGLATNSTADDHTETVTLTAAGSSYVLSRTIYDRLGRISQTITDNAAPTIYGYDGAGRPTEVVDPLDNTTLYQCDGNGNVVGTTRADACTITEPPLDNEIFKSFTWFDCLNRPVVSGTQGADGSLTDELGLCCAWQGQPSTLFSLMGYDSRRNRTTVTDPKLNILVSVYDGASRLIETQQEMRQNGDGRKAPAPNQTFLTSGGGIIRTEYLYDGNGRLIELVDDRGASTVFGYDLLDRLVTKTLADGSISTRLLDLANCLVGFTDENGSVFSYIYDAMSRQIAVEVTPASGVVGNTSLNFQYDGMARMTEATSYNLESGSFSVDFFYDSLGRILEEAQGPYGRFTTRTAWSSLVATAIVYPITDVSLTCEHDALYRKKTLTGYSAIYGELDTVGWQFFGATRIVETNFGNGSFIATQMNNARTRSAIQDGLAQPGWGNSSSDRLGFDGAGRMITKRYLKGGINGSTHAYENTAALVGFTTAFDRSDNKLYERHLHAESRSHLYQPFTADGNFSVGYDSSNRLLQYQRGILSTFTVPYRVSEGASVQTPITLPGADQIRDYRLDGLGNWKLTNFTKIDTGGSTANTSEIRHHNYLNQITSIRDTTGGTPATYPFEYDQGNGNITNDGTRIYQWDAFNRVTAISDATTEALLASYTYDALGRRIMKQVMDLGDGVGGLTGDIPAALYEYFYDGSQIIEEHTDTSFSKANFWGQYIDELLFFTIPIDHVYRVVSDLLYRSVAVVTTTNEMVEAYDTDAYGNTLCYSGPGTDDIWFTDDDVQTNNPINTTIFTGRQYDPESQLYYYRARYYSPSIGRFISRDPISSSRGINKYAYVIDNPSNWVDPTGLIGKQSCFSVIIFGYGQSNSNDGKIDPEGTQLDDAMKSHEHQQGQMI